MHGRRQAPSVRVRTRCPPPASVPPIDPATTIFEALVDRKGGFAQAFVCRVSVGAAPSAAASGERRAARRRSVARSPWTAAGAPARDRPVPHGTGAARCRSACGLSSRCACTAWTAPTAASGRRASCAVRTGGRSGACAHRARRSRARGAPPPRRGGDCARPCVTHGRHHTQHRPGPHHHSEQQHHPVDSLGPLRPRSATNDRLDRISV